MGDAAPPQPTASGYVHMQGSGAAVPQLHNAIVERLRARIALCRRHHSSCESRYQRGQAESSDREHESTLHLLSIVQQGLGNRKTKGNRTSGQQHAESNSRVNGEQKSQSAAGEESKNTTRIALHGTLRKKIEGHPLEYNPKLSRLSGEVLSSVYKRLRVEGDTLVDSSCVYGNGQAVSGRPPMAHSENRKDSGNLFSLTLKEMKREPGEVSSCGRGFVGGSMTFGFKDEYGGPMDPDLQDLFDELTKSVPPLNDQDLEKILKHDDSFGLDLNEPSSLAEGDACSQMQKVIKAEYTPGFVQDTGGSAGPDFSMATNSSSSARAAPITHSSGQDSQGSSGASRGPTGWLEVSHAEQLKQMAANQQPSALLQRQPGALYWSAPLPGLPKMLGQAVVCQQGLGAQGPPLGPLSSSHNRGLNDGLVELSRHCTPSFEESNRSVPVRLATSSTAGPQRKQQQPTAAQTHNPPGHFRSPHLAISALPCLQNKSLIQKRSIGQCGLSLHVKPDEQRQDKMNVPDRLTCHLAKPPPDYKQSKQNMAEVMQSNPYPGGISAAVTMSPALVSRASTQSHFYGNANHLLTCQEAKVMPLSSKKSFTVGTDYQQGVYSQVTMSRLEQQGEAAAARNHRPDTMATNGLTSVPAGWEPGPKQAPASPLLSTRGFPDLRQGDFENQRFSHISIEKPNMEQPLSVGVTREMALRATLPEGQFVGSGLSQGRHGSSLTLDFLPDGDNVESDFIDSLLKSGSGNDDWMKDINLEEILGTHT